MGRAEQRRLTAAAASSPYLSRMRTRPGPLRAAAAGLAAAVFLAACAAPQPPRHVVGAITVPDGCPDLLANLERIVAAEMPPPEARVVASRADTAIDVWGHRALAELRLPDLADFVRSFHSEYPVVADGRLPSAGIDGEVRSDGHVEVDLDALDELLRLTLTAAYPDLRFRALMYCYQGRLLSDGELEDRQLRIYVPGDPTVCFQGPILQPRGEGGCDAVGIAIPELTLEVPGLRLRWPATIVVSPGHHPSRLPSPEEQAALTTIHELVHFLDNKMGAYPHPATLVEYEQRANYAASALRLMAARGEVEIPIPFRWPLHVPETAEDGRR
jgi:hypothetical protein